MVIIMNNITIGIITIVYAVFLRFMSPKERDNMLGYKSIQLGTNKKIWEWTNRGFGTLALIGSVCYLLASLYLHFTQNSNFDKRLQHIGLIYIIISVVIVEVNTLIKNIKDKSKKLK